MRQYGFPFAKRKERRVTVQPKVSEVKEREEQQVAQLRSDQEPLPEEKINK